MPVPVRERDSGAVAVRTRETDTTQSGQEAGRSVAVTNTRKLY